MEKYTFTENRLDYRIERIKLKLSELLKNINYKCLQGKEDLQIDKISYNSKEEGENRVFVCISGAKRDGHQFIEEAISKGAAAVVCSKNVHIPKGTALIKVEDTRKALAVMSANYFHNPSKELLIIGVTGTKGKTSTTYMIRSILEKAGYKCGLIGTIIADTGKAIVESNNTTPESYQIQQYLREMIEASCNAAVIEVSSQALMLSRVEEIEFDYGVFTNLDEDHIGPNEHRSMEEYIHWKSTLFQRCKMGIINGDDEFKDRILEGHTCQTKFFGFNPGNDLKGEKYKIVKNKGKLAVEFQLKGVYNSDLAVGIPGRFTAYNGMAAALVASCLDISFEIVEKALINITVPGREEMFTTCTGGTVIIDYAHNGMALESILKSLREYEPTKLTCVFGCGGERDRERRFRMGQISSELADFTLITSDNPRNEPPLAIISDIIMGVKRANGKYYVIPDRREAIKQAVFHCQPGEITLIAGKGHENYQILGDKKIHFDDKEEVLAAIEKVKYEQHNNR